MVPTQILGAAIGVLPGVMVGVLVGVILDVYRTRKEEKQEKRQWYGSMRMLAKQAEQVTNEEDIQLSYLIPTYNSIISDLRENVLNAPIYDEEVSDASIDLAQKCLKARNEATEMRHSSDLQDKMVDTDEFKDLIQSSKALAEKANTAMEKI